MASMFDPSGMYGGGVPTAITNALKQRQPQVGQMGMMQPDQRLSLPRDYSIPSGNTGTFPRDGGYTGPGSIQPMNPGGQPLPPQAQAPQTPAAQGGLGAFGGKLEGFDWNKMNSGHNSPKYQFGRVFSQFDPKGGITQGMLDQLNQLGLGTVTGKIGGDKISIGGQVDPRFEGMTEFDVIRDLENGGGWQWGGIGGGTARRQRGIGGSAVLQALGGGHPAYAPGFAGNAPHAASSWLNDLLRSLGVSL